MNDWVSVDDRLPEEKGEYLVTYHPCYWDRVQDEVCVGIDTFRGKTAWAKKKISTYYSLDATSRATKGGYK